jgi:hypothetical protein
MSSAAAVRCSLRRCRQRPSWTSSIRDDIG